MSARPMHGRRSAALRARHARRGFTIVEVLVAVMVLSVGVLGLASSAAVVTRQLTDGGRRGQAAGLAQSRFDSLASRGTAGPTGCDAIATIGNTVTGITTTNGIEERWRAKRTGNVTATVTDSVLLPRAKAPIVFQSIVRCQP